MTINRSQQTVSLDVTLKMLANQYRRRVLIALLDHNPQRDDDLQLPTDSVLPDGEIDRLKIEMRHAHLPKLHEAGIIEWNRETNSIRKGPHFEEVRPLLELIQNHADELPDGWI